MAKSPMDLPKCLSSDRWFRWKRLRHPRLERRTLNGPSAEVFSSSSVSPSETLLLHG